MFREELNKDEKNILLEYWKQNNMTEFNNWAQVANSQVEYQFNELDMKSKEIST